RFEFFRYLIYICKAISKYKLKKYKKNIIYFYNNYIFLILYLYKYFNTFFRHFNKYKYIKNKYKLLNNIFLFNEFFLKVDYNCYFLYRKYIYFFRFHKYNEYLACNKLF